MKEFLKLDEVKEAGLDYLEYPCGSYSYYINNKRILVDLVNKNMTDQEILDKMKEILDKIEDNYIYDHGVFIRCHETGSGDLTQDSQDEATDESERQFTENFESYCIDYGLADVDDDDFCTRINYLGDLANKKLNLFYKIK